ncbi:energy transducer TonB [Zunongwangia sp. SCSIO 43204]|uniref:Peptidase M56 BlaR1 n=1 Tax=Zunongwangia atlantica 22II14-10F7 TaxID=1185767 RepID=A0A1Y1T5Z3_9FLAO|nr:MULTISPECIES: energy transducer TonB [Zunongwangia]ORL46458.1 peptidase M56 BlaR1 [Zunongwangia atlantica 22II14-10F7]UAB83458.1 energy transducer TonB [Zunongwangia sp. SCSIO 43204]
MLKKLFSTLLFILICTFANAQSDPSIDGLDLKVVDRIPVAKNCDPNASNKDLAKCFSKSVRNTIMARVDTAIINSQNLEPGLYTAIAKFRINKKGKVDQIFVDFENKKIAKNIKLAVKKIRRLKPAMKDGKAVNVMYAVPVKFKI